MPHCTENVVKVWNEEINNIANEVVRKVRFFFNTDQGPGHVDSLVNAGVNMETAKSIVMRTLHETDAYTEIELLKYEILEIY